MSTYLLRPELIRNDKVDRQKQGRSRGAGKLVHHLGGGALLVEFHIANMIKIRVGHRLGAAHCHLAAAGTKQQRKRRTIRRGLTVQKLMDVLEASQDVQLFRLSIPGFAT